MLFSALFTSGDIVLVLPLLTGLSRCFHINVQSLLKKQWHQNSLKTALRSPALQNTVFVTNLTGFGQEPVRSLLAVSLKVITFLRL